MNNKNIYQNEVDSLVKWEVYELKKNVLNSLISKNILINEAKKQNLPLDSLIEYQINSKIKKVTDKDIKRYINKLEIAHIDTNQISDYLLSQNKENRQTRYIDSLRQYYDIKIKLQSPYYRKINTSDLYTQNVTKFDNSLIDVHIITNFNCPMCQKNETKVRNLLKKYKNKVNFKFIFLSQYIDEMILACAAAGKQDKFWKMYKEIVENRELLNKDSISYDFAEKIELDLDKFIKDMEDNQILKKLVQNREYLLSNDVYFTPTYIVDGKIIDNENAIDYLENLIIESLNQNQI